MWYDAVNDNTFTVYSYDNTSSPYIDAWGLYMTYCHGFHVEGNNFSSSSIFSINPINTYGIVVDNSNPKANCGWVDDIYRNSFHNLMIGCQAQGSNDESRNYNVCSSDNAGADGLVFGCNNYFNTISTTDIGIAGSSSTIASYQGNFGAPPSNAPYPFGPANNQFNQAGSFSYVELSNMPLSGDDFAYFYYPNATPYQPTVGEYTPTNITPYLASVNNTCPSELAPPPCIPCQIVGIAASKAAIPALESNIDGSNTSGLLNDIATQSPGQIRSNLLAASPYLSDTVLATAVRAGLPAGIVKAIILANSPVSPYIMSLLNGISLPSGIRNQINSAQTGISAMDTLQSAIAGNMQNIGASINALIYHYLQDTSLSYRQRIDSALYIIKVYGVHTGEQLCQMTAAYSALNDTVRMDSVITVQTNNGPLDNFCKILQIFNSLQNNPSGTSGITGAGDTATLASVQGISTDTTANVNNTFDNGTAAAQALLDEVFKLPKYAIYVEPLNNAAQDLERTAHNSTASSGMPAFTLYPNPNHGSFTMNYSLNKGDNAGVELYNYMGSKVKTYVLDPTNTTLKINEPNLPAGVYLYRVLVNGQMQHTGKLVILK